MDKKRIFLACQISEDARQVINQVSQELKESQFGLKFTPKNQLHLTLAFLERVEESELAKVFEITEGACRGFVPFSLFLSNLGAFPNLKLPIVVYAALSGDTSTLTNLAKKIQKGLLALGFDFNQEFTSHVTIARIKSYVPKTERRHLGETIQRWGKLTPVKTQVAAVYIFESTPTSAGHIHTLLEKINLGKS